MMLSVVLALFLPCAGMSVVFLVYLCLLWIATVRSNRVRVGVRLPVKQPAEKGLSAAELEKLPKVTGKELVMGTECAVCLDEILGEEPARVVPGCNHGFHLLCLDTWLAKNSVCPVCRAQLQRPQIVDPIPPDDNPC